MGRGNNVKKESIEGKRVTGEESFAGRVIVIPATKRTAQSGKQTGQVPQLRVAAYCRVSTGDESQQTSYTMQKDFYTGMIRNRAGWILAGIYADEAITGTSRVRRVQFNRMIEDAVSGRIDYIVTKSISRFARNTVDTLDCVRQLRQLTPPVGIYFEKENIDTLDAKSELLLTILSALAQEESRSISDNIRWTLRRRFREGKPQINLKRMIGYDPTQDGGWAVNGEQARVVQSIFESFLNGKSGCQIARELNEACRWTVNGRRWTSGGVYIVLRNEKYVGDLEMQKTVTQSYLTHRSSVNRGEEARYYVKDHHEAIIDRLTWERTRTLLGRQEAKRGQKEKQVQTQAEVNSRGCVSPFHILRCAVCGAGLERMSYTARARKDSGEAAYDYYYPVW
ncbi:MAG: recombinase family protein [Eubacteriales bacterium]|nr:recombinase family protein [Eubacteriales bacterium]